MRIYDDAEQQQQQPQQILVNVEKKIENKISFRKKIIMLLHCATV